MADPEVRISSALEEPDVGMQGDDSGEAVETGVDKAQGEQGTETLPDKSSARRTTFIE